MCPLQSNAWSFEEMKNLVFLKTDLKLIKKKFITIGIHLSPIAMIEKFILQSRQGNRYSMVRSVNSKKKILYQGSSLREGTLGSYSVFLQFPKNTYLESKYVSNYNA